jgi:hypothetical protein
VGSIWLEFAEYGKIIADTHGVLAHSVDSIRLLVKSGYFNRKKTAGAPPYWVVAAKENPQTDENKTSRSGK